MTGVLHWLPFALPGAVLAALGARQAWRAFKRPAPASPPVPGSAPGAGARPLPQAAHPPNSPGTGPAHGHAKRDRLLTARFFADGCVLVWDAHGHLTHVFEAGGRDWDAWLEEITDDQR